jgi:hypothetical protein
MAHHDVLPVESCYTLHDSVSPAVFGVLSDDVATLDEQH